MKPSPLCTDAIVLDWGDRVSTNRNQRDLEEVRSFLKEQWASKRHPQSAIQSVAAPTTSTVFEVLPAVDVIEVFPYIGVHPPVINGVRRPRQIRGPKIRANVPPKGPC